MAESIKNDVITHGTMIKGCEKTAKSLDRFTPIGIESVEIFFWETIPHEMNHLWMEGIAKRCNQSGIKISSLGLYANPLRNPEYRKKAEKDWNTVIDFAVEFQIPVVSGFTGRKPDTILEESYQEVNEFFTPIVNKCIEKDKKLAFENCPLDGDRFNGDWNTAFLPEVWDVLLNDFFQTDSVGLEFDPAHLVQLDFSVLELAEKWKKRIHHVHGKDAQKVGTLDFCFPGEGLTDWSDLLHLLKTAGYKGSVDLEGYHGQFISHEIEIKKQKKSLEFLRDSTF